MSSKVEDDVQPAEDEKHAERDQCPWTMPLVCQSKTQAEGRNEDIQRHCEVDTNLCVERARETRKERGVESTLTARVVAEALSQSSAGSELKNERKRNAAHTCIGMDQVNRG